MKTSDWQNTHRLIKVWRRRQAHTHTDPHCEQIHLRKFSHKLCSLHANERCDNWDITSESIPSSSFWGAIAIALLFDPREYWMRQKFAI